MESRRWQNGAAGKDLLKGCLDNQALAGYRRLGLLERAVVAAARRQTLGHCNGLCNVVPQKQASSLSRHVNNDPCPQTCTNILYLWILEHISVTDLTDDLWKELVPFSPSFLWICSLIKSMKFWRPDLIEILLKVFSVLLWTKEDTMGNVISCLILIHMVWTAQMGISYLQLPCLLPHNTLWFHGSPHLIPIDNLLSTPYTIPQTYLPHVLLAR